MIASTFRKIASAMFPPTPPEAGRWTWDQVDLSLLPADFREAVARYEAARAVKADPADCGCAPGAICSANSACPRLHLII